MPVYTAFSDVWKIENCTEANDDFLAQAAAEEEASGVGDTNATSLLRGMTSRAARVEAEITRRLRSEFASLVKPRQGAGPGPGFPEGGQGGVTGDTVAGGGGGGRKRQALLSCLRPFSALGSGIEAEKQFAR